MNSFSFRVSRFDIAHGKRRRCDACPVAMALMRRFPGSKASVGAQTSIQVDFVSCDRILITRIPHELSRFIMAFDNVGRHAVKPSTFTVPYLLNYTTGYQI